MAKRHAELALNARWVAPMDHAKEGEEVLEEHSVLIGGEEILAVLPRTEAEATFAVANTLELENHLLTPGLINGHTHAAMSLMRGLADDLPLMRWLEEHIWPTEAALMSAEFVRDGTTLAIAEMIRSGTTCMNDMYFFPDIAAQTAIDCGMRAMVGLIVIEFPSAWAASTDEYFSRAQSVHDKFRSQPLISTCFAPHAPYTVDDAGLARVAKIVEELDIPVTIHVHETAAEIDASVGQFGERPLTRLKRLGLLNERLIAVHMTQLTEAEINDLAGTAAAVIHCPESNMKLASGYAPVVEMRAAGISVGLGTDGAASNNDLDLLGEMRTAALLAKHEQQDACALSAVEVLKLATCDGAKALGLGEQIGSLAAGKKADIVAFDLSDERALPVFDPLAQIVYSGHRDLVQHVWIGGRQVLDNRQLTTIDTSAIRARAEYWREEIRKLS